MKTAEALLAKSIGIHQATPFMKDNIDTLLDTSEPNPAILTLVASEMLRKE
jgi:hypothetical protein